MPTPELRKTLEFIEGHPEKHDQSVWIWPSAEELMAVREGDKEEVSHCGTAACLAGWGLILHKPEAATRYLRGGFHVIQEAAVLFGLQYDVAWTLFQGHWTVADLRAGVDWLEDNPDGHAWDLSQVMSRAREERTRLF